MPSPEELLEATSARRDELLKEATRPEIEEAVALAGLRIHKAKNATADTLEKLAALQQAKMRLQSS